MTNAWNNALGQQFRAAITMLENAIEACPEELWNRESKFWYIAYHTLFYLDCYLADDADNFIPPQPFTLSEFDPAGLMPDRVYSKAELLKYLNHGKQKCGEVIEKLTGETGSAFVKNSNKPDFTNIEMLLYNLRHVQHHVAQLNLILRQAGYDAPAWVARG